MSTATEAKPKTLEAQLEEDARKNPETVLYEWQDEFGTRMQIRLDRRGFLHAVFLCSAGTSAPLHASGSVCREILRLAGVEWEVK